MQNAGRIREILDEIESLEREIAAGEKAWSEGDDPCAMAACDPSDAYVKGGQIDELKSELKTLVMDL